jgi:hypothetical protein
MPLNSERETGYSLICQFDVGEHERNQVTVDSEGVVTGFIQQTQPGFPLREIGTFYMPLAAEDSQLVELGELIRNEGLTTGEPFLTDLRFGKRYKVFVIEAGGEELIHSIGMEEPLPEALDRLEEHVTLLFGRLVSAPQRTASIEIGLAPETIAAGNELRVELRFRNRGSFAAEIRNPASFALDSPDSMKVNFWRRRENEQGEMSDHYEWTLDLASREFLLSEHDALPSDSPYLEIPPDGQVITWTSVRFPRAEPENYLAELVYYASPATAKELETRDNLIVGEYHSDTTPLVITGPVMVRNPD